MFSTMKHHSRRLTDSLKSKADNAEVIAIKEWAVNGYEMFTPSIPFCILNQNMCLITEQYFSFD